MKIVSSGIDKYFNTNLPIYDSYHTNLLLCSSFLMINNENIANKTIII